MISRQTACSLGVLALIAFPTTLLARVNTMTTGLSTSYDFYDRSSEPTATDPAATLPTANTTDTDEDDYSRIAVSPLLIFVSDSQENHFELRAAPSIKYDLLGSQTDWDNDLFVSAIHSLNKSWQLNISNAYLRSDYQNTLLENAAATDTQNTQDTTPELSSDLGRIRYWRNTLTAGSTYNYDQESKVAVGGDFIVLRNDESATDSYDDYDRYAFHLKNDHRFNDTWKTITNLSLVRGDYEPTNLETPVAESETIAPETSAAADTNNFSNDLTEYHFLATLENHQFLHNTLLLNYNYIGAHYDEALIDTGEIHQSRLSWKREFSKRLNTTLGAGPSYEKTSGYDANWGGNGIAEVNYLLQHGSFTFGVEKRYDVDNFSGTDERGIIDYWDTHLLLNYQLTEHVSINGRLAYRYEDRTDSTISPDDPLTSEASTLATYHKDKISTGLGLRYEFLRYYSAGLNYTFTSQDSERIEDDYDDHRLLFTLAWKQEWLRW
jgi:hypothetical protein